MLITPISQTNYSFKNEDSRSVQTKQNGQSFTIFSYGISALMAFNMLDRTSKTRLQKLFAEEVEGKNKTKEMNLHKTVEIEIKSFKDDTIIESIDNLVGLNKIKDLLTNTKHCYPTKKQHGNITLNLFHPYYFWGCLARVKRQQQRVSQRS